MFKPVGLFHGTPCPLSDRCNLLKCIFAHHEDASSDGTSRSVQSPGVQVNSTINDSESPPPLKRRRVSTGDTGPDQYLDSLQRTIPHGSVLQKPKPVSNGPQRSSVSVTKVPGGYGSKTGTNIDPSASTVTKPTSPSATVNTPKRKRAELKAEALNPRILSRPPAAHAIRLRLLKMMHEQMVRLNDELMKGDDASAKEELGLSKQGLITKALDEEEKAAKANVSVYANVLKLRIVALKKMKVDAWRLERAKELPKPKLKPEAASHPVDIKTGLTSQEEIFMLSQFISPQEGLAQHGYVVVPPSQEQIEQARKGVESAQGWESCDRCETRFQVFPGRREEDGALTSGGQCTYHWGRKRYPERLQGQSGQRDMRWTCCHQDLGTTGCVAADHHVFKVSEAKRLALVTPFKETPVEGPNVPDKAVCFDCEMGYTTQGMELIRLTATNWPDGKELLDVLVRPIGEILDLNSRFSGIWPQAYTEAVPYDTTTKAKGKSSGKLHIVDSPMAARELLFSCIDTTTPLIGHAIENDLNAVRIVHPTIIDTVLLYPHPKGLPVRFGLKALAYKHLGKEIQTGGAQGHDSKEDAQAAGDLVRYQVAKKWESMRLDGWRIVDGVFHSPDGNKTSSVA